MWLELTIFTICTILGLRMLKHQYLANPVFGFLIFNWLMGVGLFPMFDQKEEADVTHAIIMVLSPLLVTMGALVASDVFKISRSYKKFWSQREIGDNDKLRKRFTLLLLFSVLISFIYYYFVGYNLLFQSLTSSIDDFTTMRLESYSGSNYLAPGVVNQFKNTLLPILFFYFAYYLRSKKYFILYITCGIPILLYCLGGTGQRTFIFYAILLFLYISFVYSRGQFNKRLLLSAVAIFFVVFIFLSQQLQRIDNASVSSGIEGLFYRLFSSNQASSLIGFRYVYTQETQYGAEWLLSFVGLIPGQEGSNLSHVIHDIMFSSIRGTAPISIWGSAYYNFGFIGVLIFAFSIGFVYEAIFSKFLKGPLIRSRVFAYSACFLYLSTYVAGSPAQLFNNGLPAVFLLLFIIKNTTRVKSFRYKTSPGLA